MSHTEYVPIVSTKGDVIGKTPAIEAVNYKNAYINPVIRIAISTHGMLLDVYKRQVLQLLFQQPCTRIEPLEKDTNIRHQ